MKKFLLLILTIMLIIVSSMGLIACGGETESESGTTEQDSEIYAVYNLYVANAEENGETPLSYERWLKSIKGEKGDAGIGILSIEKTSTSGLIDIYTITYTDSTTTTFTVTNGATGEQGQQGIQGIQGVKGADGHTPVITIGENGNWYIDGVDTTKQAQGIQGETGNGISSIAKTSTDGLVDTYTITFTNGSTTTFTVTNGKDGEQGEQGIQGIQGVKGADGKTPVITIGENGNWYVDGVDTTKPSVIKGETGNGISSIAKTSTSGLVDTYTITFTNGTTTTFTVTNGATGEQGQQGIQGIQGVKGADGHTPVITIGENGNWYIDGVDTTKQAQGIQGETGNGISSIAKTNTNGLVDTYTITFTNGNTTTFTVTNGKDGEQGQQGIQGIQGVKGADGHTPVITIGENGNWYIDGVDTTKPSSFKGETGNGISSIEKTDTTGLVDTYTITFTNGETTTFTVTNGEQGQQGVQGKSSYEIFKENYPEYEGSEKEWITAVAMGDICTLFGHKYDEGEITTPATKGNDGVKTYTCTVCQKTKTEIVPKIEVAEAEIYEVEGKKYVNFGSYPQTHISDTAIITELNKLTETNACGYYEYGGKEYAKITATPRNYGSYNDKYGNAVYYTYSDGTRVQYGTTEWFLVEPIKWRVLSQEDDSVKVVSDLIIDTSCYYVNTYYRNIEGVDIAPNNYKYSTIREFLNGTFYNSAFSTAQQNAIITTEVDNSASSTGFSTNQYACENTFDKVYLLSYSEVTNSTYFADDTARQMKVTDYANASGAYCNTSTETGSWWLRSPIYCGDYDARIVWYNGDYAYDHVMYTGYGVVPALQISLG